MMRVVRKVKSVGFAMCDEKMDGGHGWADDGWLRARGWGGFCNMRGLESLAAFDEV